MRCVSLDEDANPWKKPVTIVTDHVRSTREGNVFTHVCDFVPSSFGRHGTYPTPPLSPLPPQLGRQGTCPTPVLLGKTQTRRTRGRTGQEGGPPPPPAGGTGMGSHGRYCLVMLMVACLPGLFFSSVTLGDI